MRLWGTLHKDCHQRAVALISLFDSVEKDQVQLQRCNHIKQNDADCGRFVIAYMEQGGMQKHIRSSQQRLARPAAE